MQGSSATRWSLIGWLGSATGRGLRQLSAAVREAPTSARTGYDQVCKPFSANPGRSRQLKAPVRAFGFFLLGFLAIVLILTSRHALGDPLSIGVALAALWSFPTAWQRVPSAFRKILLIALATIVNAGLWRLMSTQGFWKVGTMFGLQRERDLGLIVMGSATHAAALCCPVRQPGGHEPVLFGVDWFDSVTSVHESGEHWSDSGQCWKLRMRRLSAAPIGRCSSVLMGIRDGREQYG